ncbi:terminase large subunit [Eubacteriales bacterium OttesenSCG-928-A19]|nr:terminase large subunit [Eubacteriales bacterium OttesenSCG-928-A19]
MSISSPHILRYLEMVEGSDEYPVCKDQIKLCAHVRRCFDTETLIVDEERLEKYLTYQKYFPFDLFPWEVFVFTLHCCVFTEDGEPRWPDLLLYVGRGAGKNAYLSFEDFCLLTKTHGVRHYDIDLCATNEDQAIRTFKDVYDVLVNPENRILAKAFEWNKVEIRNKQTSSVLRYRTNNPRGKDGGRPGKVDFDEVHEYENYDNIRVFVGGFGKKPHPRRTYATTDGFVRGGVIDDLKQRAMDILDGKQPDEGLLPFICRLDHKSEADDERMWHKANPSLRYLPALLKETRKEYREMGMAASLQSAFFSKRMNIPEGNRDLEVTSWDNIMACSQEIPYLRGRAAIVGIDFAKTTDFASAGVLIPDGDMLYWITHSWLCAQSVDIPRLKCPWQEWANDDLLTIVDDVEIGAHLIAEWIAVQAEYYSIVKVAMDSFRYGLLSRSLEDIGFSREDRKNIKLTRPSDVMKVSPVIESKFAKHQIAYGDNPLMRWAVNNTKMIRTGVNRDTGNMTYGKIEGRSRKTDPFMAFVAAMTCEHEIARQFDPAAMESMQVWTF